MQKIKAFLSSIPKWKLLLFSGGFITLTALIIFISPILRRQAVIKLGSASGLVITADKQDSLGIFNDSRFTLKSDEDLTVKAVRDNLKIEPDTKVEVIEVSPRQYQIIPKEPLNSNEIIKIKLSTGDREYSWAFQTKNNFRIVRTLPADKTTSVPTNSGIEITFSHDNFQDIDNYFTISPKVDGRFERHQRTVSFVPKSLEPDTLYTISVKKGIKLNGSIDTTTDTTTFQFETASSTSSYDQNRFNLVRLAYEFSSKETPAIDLYANNIDSLSTVKVNVYKYSSINKFSEDYKNKLLIPRWAVNAYDRYLIPTTGLTKTLEFDAPIQKANYSGYFLFPQTMEKGSYLIEVENGNKKTQALVQVTDLSAYFTVSGNQTMAWVNRVDNNTPAVSAKVTVFGQEYTTDKDGVSIFPSPTELVENANQLIVIKDSQDTLFIPAADRNYYYPYGDYESTRRISDKYWSYLYLDRPIYKPEDTVRFWGLLRDRDDINKSQKLTISLTNSSYLDYNFDQVTIYEKEYQTSNNGTFIGEITLPKLNPGWYNLNIKVNGKNVISSGLDVATYTKPAYQLTLNSSRNAVIAGEPIELSGQAAFFEGTPVSNINLKLFGPNENKITSDIKGQFGFTINTVSNPENDYGQPQYQYFSVTPSQSEEGDISAGTSVAVFNSSIYLKAKSEVKNNLAKVTMKLNQIDLTKFEPYQYGDDASYIGSPVQNYQVKGELIEISYVKKEIGTYYDFINKITSPKYQYQQIYNSLGQFTILTDSQGQAIYEFPTTNDKYYQLKLSSQDSSNRVTSTTAYVYGSNNYSFSGEKSLSLLEDKTTPNPVYLVDEPVSLTPLLGSDPIPTGKILYIFSQRGIKGYSVLDTNKFTFNFKENFVPNIYVQAVRFTGTTYQLSEYKILYFDNSSKKISLDLKLDKLFYKPGDKANLSISTRDQKGNPVSSEVNINLVDEAIFQISPVNTDPLSQIYRSLNSDIVSFYLSHQYPVDSSPAEGGGCFLPGTKVLMSNGSLKNIEDIRANDHIKTRSSDSNSSMVEARVSQVLTHEVGSYLLLNGHLRVTPEHNLYINGRWMVASEVRIGDSYLDTNNKYQLISSIEKYNGKFTVYNLSVEKYHTYFADGVYVHNEKGRGLFVDTAYFGNVQTGSNGLASLSISLPDNLTSWRITSQSISQDLKVGVKTEKLVVKQPFFIDLILGEDYLLSDQPVLALRGFGDELNSDEKVNFQVSIPTLNFKKDISSTAFESVGVPLPNLALGTHKVTITANAGALRDTLIRSFNVVTSRIQLSKSDFTNISPDTKITGSTDGVTELTFSDQNSGRFLNTLKNISYSSGDRLDQKLSRVLSSELIKKYFDNSVAVESFDSTIYSDIDGGFALLPYGSSDPKLSMEVACLAADRIDKPGLVNYFYDQLSKAKETLTASQSLAGLACLKEPVLIIVDKFFSLPDLDPQSKIYLSLAQSKLGDTEKSSNTVKALLKDFGENQDNISFVKIGNTKDDYLENTSWLSAIAAIDDINVADLLYNYVSVNSTKDIVVDDSVLLYINSRISKIPSSPVNFSYMIDGKKTSKSLKSGETFKILVSASQLKDISFTDITGNVGVVSVYDSKDFSTNTSKDLKLDRSFSVSGKTTTEFVTSDLVKVSLSYSLSEKSQDGCYQISDYLPSGLRIVTSLFSRNIPSQDISYPYLINGQKVSFCVYKQNLKPISYYARVLSPGIFKAENALMQSLVSPSIFTFSNQTPVTIK